MASIQQFAFYQRLCLCWVYDVILYAWQVGIWPLVKHFSMHGILLGGNTSIKFGDHNPFVEHSRHGLYLSCVKLDDLHLWPRRLVAWHSGRTFPVLRSTCSWRVTTYPSIIYLSKTSKHINRANRFKNTYNIGLDAKVHVGLFNRLHVAHKIILKLKWFTITYA